MVDLPLEESPFNEVNKLLEDKPPGDDNRIIYTLRTRAVGLEPAKVKAKMWARANNPFNTDTVTVVQVLDPEGNLIEGDSPHLTEDKDPKPEPDEIIMRQVFDVMVSVTR